jgi:type I restriction enzyme S subunit
MKMELDELPEGWELKPLGACVAPKEIWNQSKNPRERICYVELAGIDNERGVIATYGEIEAASAPSRAKKVMRAGDVLFATTRPNLKNIAIVPAKLDNEICSTGFCVLRPKADEITSGWVYSVVRSDWFVSQVVRQDEKNAYPSVSDDEVCAVEIPVPPLPEQRRLVARIEALTGRLEQARQARQTAITETATCLRAAIARAFADADESSLRPLGEVTGIIGGNSVPENAPLPGNGEERIGLMKVSDMNASGNERFITSCRLETNRAAAVALKLRIVPVGAVVFPKRGGAIATNKKRVLSIPAALDPNMMGVYPQPKSGLTSDFLYRWFESLDLAELQDDGGIPQVNKKHLDPLLIPVLAESEQRVIVALLDALHRGLDELRRLQREVEAELAAFTPALLAKAFRGEL